MRLKALQRPRRNLTGININALGRPSSDLLLSPFLKRFTLSMRRGQYRKQSLIQRFGPDIPLPDLRQEIAHCERHGKMHDACMVRYPDLIPSSGGIRWAFDVMRAKT